MVLYGIIIFMRTALISVYNKEGIVEFAQRQAENVSRMLQFIGKVGKNYKTFALIALQ